MEYSTTRLTTIGITNRTSITIMTVILHFSSWIKISRSSKRRHEINYHLENWLPVRTAWSADDILFSYSFLHPCAHSDNFILVLINLTCCLLQIVIIYMYSMSLSIYLYRQTGLCSLRLENNGSWKNLETPLLESQVIWALHNKMCVENVLLPVYC